MGVIATVVYDIKKHKTIVLRATLASPKTRHQIHDTIASFSHHCESLVGVAKSPTEVSALWGGPPFVSYAISELRFRVIVIWDEQTADINVAYDVYHAVIRLERAVSSVVDALARAESPALAHVYNEAGYALRGDDAIIIPSSDMSRSSTRSKLLPTVSLQARRSSAATTPLAQRKKKGGNAATSGLFGRIGAALRTATGPSEAGRSARARQGRGAQGGAEGADETVFGPDGAFDDAEGALELPDDVFLWCDFGKVLPENAESADWFGNMIGAGGAVPPSGTPKVLPALRAGSATSSTPLTVPSSGRPFVPSDTPSSIGVTPSSHGTSRNMPASSAAGEGASGLSLAKLPDTTSSNEVTSNAPSVSAPGVIPAPLAISGVMPSSNPASGTGGSTRMSASIQGSSRQTTPAQTSLQTVSAEHNPTPTPASSQRHSSVEHNPTLTPVSSQSHQHLLLQQQQERLLLQQQAQQQNTQSSMPSSQQSIQSVSETPESLRKKNDDFDVSQLGGMKDSATVTVQGSSGPASSDVSTPVDDAIRARMNEFALTMQAGNFPLALQQVYGTLRYLCRLQPRRDREITTCSNYVLAQKILIRNAALENELTRCVRDTPDAIRRQVESALLAMFLSELKHLLPRHRVAAMRVAVEKNMAVGNFGMSARWLRQLVEKAPPAQKAAIANQLQQCLVNGEKNAHMPSTNRLCFATLQVITSPYGKCDVCAAVYHATLSGVVDGQACDTCFVGTIHSQA